MTKYRQLLACLANSQVEFIVVGGIAAVLHGSIRLTMDVDVVYRRSEENLRLLVTALAPVKPYLRGAPPGLPFQWDFHTLKQGLNFTLQTELGDIDLLGEIVGGGTYEDLFKDAEVIPMDDFGVRVVSLRQLIALKRAAGRPKDFDGIADLVALDEESSEPPGC